MVGLTGCKLALVQCLKPLPGECLPFAGLFYINLFIILCEIAEFKNYVNLSVQEEEVLRKR